MRNSNPLLVDRNEAERRFHLDPGTFGDMVTTLFEEGFITSDSSQLQRLVWRLRGLAYGERLMDISEYEWNNPREALDRAFNGRNYSVRLTYRGLRRIEELGELLKRDRILEPFGILLDVRYVEPDLRDQLARRGMPVSVIRLDLDGFKSVNDGHGHAAGDEVLKAYLTAVRDTIGDDGTAYRAGGDEVAAVLAGLEHAGVLRVAELKTAIADMLVQHQGARLPRVTASIGVASTPPAQRTPDLEAIADDAQRRAKAEGKNRVVDGTPMSG